MVKVHEVGSDGDTYFLVMELIDGRDGGQIVKRCRERKIPWPLDFAVYLTKVLLDALAYAHDAKGPTGKPLGIVHCDVSPSNLFISRTGDIKLGDFGVARGAHRRAARRRDGQAVLPVARDAAGADRSGGRPVGRHGDALRAAHAAAGRSPARRPTRCSPRSRRRAPVPEEAARPTCRRRWRR